MIKLLEGVRVVECAVLFNGDQTGRLLGDLGADVIKVEAPGVGDYLRDILGQLSPHNSPAHVFANRNKRSITVDLRSDDGRETFFDLIRTADIFVDGFAGDACDKLGIGYEAQRAVKPDIIYAQCSGFGSVGEYAQIPTHGQMMGALGGGTPLLMGDDGLAHEQPGGMGDGTMAAATHTALTAVAALHQRDRTGEGCRIDGAGGDAVLATQWIRPTYLWNDARLTDRRGAIGRDNALMARYHFYETSDQRFVLFCGIEPKFWKNFCRAIDRPDLAEHGDADAAVDFGKGELELAHMMQEIFHTKTQREWIDIALEYDIALGPAHRVDDLYDDPHLNAREIIIEHHHPHVGPVTLVGWAAPVAGQPFEVTRHAPLLGEHTAEILAELGRIPA
ncbi:MAG TPA: CoA transferase [Ilumatobacter sp.]|nr:CoA transferase [Ilumatobacter sp.]